MTAINVNSTNSMDIPDTLTEFIPYATATVNLPMWKIVHDIDNSTIEFVKNNVLNRHLFFVLTILWVICGCIISLVFFYAPNLPEGMLVFVVCSCVVLALVFFSVIIPLVYAVALHINSTHWHGKLRFRYNTVTGTLYFPRERTEYHRDSYSRLVLGYTQGYDATGRKEILGSIVNPGRYYGAPGFQFYILVCDKEGRWTRHILATDAVFLTIKSAIETLSQYGNFETITRKMSLKECYEKQVTLQTGRT